MQQTLSVADLPSRIERVQLVPVQVGEAFAFFSDASNLEAITPPWLRFRILTPRPIEMRQGALIEYRLTLHGASVRWRTRIEQWQPTHRFTDVQVSGPFRLWEHTHVFEAHPDGTLISDTVLYRMPYGALGALAHRIFIARDLTRIFDYRRDVVSRMLGGSPDVAGALSAG